MNCLDVCRQLATDPQHLSEMLEKHLIECKQCSAYALEQKKLHQKIHQALNVDVPEGLAQKILLRQAIEQQKRKASKFKYLTIAAAIVLSIGLLSFVVSPSTQTLESVVLAHINNEMHHLHELKQVSESHLVSMLKTVRLGIKQKPGEMTYAGTCVIRKSDGVHIVVKGKRGKVTVLLMPGEYVSRQTSVSDKHFKGEIYPTAYGSMAVVGEPGENIEKVRKEFALLVNYKR